MTASTFPALGTLLRRLTETLEGDVAAAYARAGLDYIPRYTPVVRALTALGPASIRAIAEFAEISHSAVSQTVAQMQKRGLVRTKPGPDARERIVHMTPKLQRLLPVVSRHWTAAAVATESLDAELPYRLSQLLREALVALDRRPFTKRLAQAADASHPQAQSQRATRRRGRT